ncbi:MAG: aldehyde dehydrogenase family protein [Planktomarina sp.]
MDGAQLNFDDQDALFAEYDVALADLNAAKDDWVKLTPMDRVALLSEMRDGIMKVAEDWAHMSARKKGLTVGAPVSGEEWLTGPYATLSAVDAFMSTLSQMDGKTFIDHLPKRDLPNGQLAVKVLPHSIWDRLILSGVTAEVWMQDGITRDNLKAHTAMAYDVPVADRVGKVALVLGAGNIAAITPLDVLQKLLLEDQVVILKMNPINDYLTDFYKIAMKPFIDSGFLRIVKGDAKGGAYLCDHPIVEELHITGSDATHDAIVWGTGAEGAANKKAGTPKNTKRFTSELGAISPAIIVPGPWSAADIQFQAENIATMKLHNSGHNCVAMQTLVMPKDWAQGDALMDKLKSVIATSTRPTWYPGSDKRMADYAYHGGDVDRVSRGSATPAMVIGEMPDRSANQSTEVFGPAFGVKKLEAPTAEAFLIAAIEYSNSELWGTLGANIVIHPKTIQQIGKQRFDEILGDLKYGTIAVNTWTGLGFLITACPWGAYPGHTLDDVGSGIGTVHNSFMMEKTEKVIVRAPWRPFPRGLLSGQLTLLPRPPFFITNKKQHKLGPLLIKFQFKPSFLKLPRIFLNALLG